MRKRQNFKTFVGGLSLTVAFAFGTRGVGKWDKLGLACTKGNKWADYDIKLSTFSNTGADGNKLIDLGGDIIDDIETLDKIGNVGSLAQAAATSSAEALAEAINLALDEAGLPDYNTFSTDAGKSALDQLGNLSDAMAKDDTKILFRGGMIIINIRCCECICKRTWYTAFISSKNVVECGDWKKFVYVPDRNGEVFTLDDWNKGFGEMNDIMDGVPKQLNKINPLEIATALRMAKTAANCDK